jgi:hypothetical protein
MLPENEKRIWNILRAMNASMAAFKPIKRAHDIELMPS